MISRLNRVIKSKLKFDDTNIHRASYLNEDLLERHWILAIYHQTIREICTIIIKRSMEMESASPTARMPRKVA